MSLKRAITLAQMVENRGVFRSTGYSRLIVRTGDTETEITIPIKTAGVAEVLEANQADEPIPPTVERWVEAKSEMGQRLGLETDGIVLVPDLSDAAYVRAVSEHNKDSVWRVVILGINLPWIDESGTEITDFERKKQILKSEGITGPHLDQLFIDIHRLVSHDRNRADFLSVASSESAGPNLPESSATE